MKTTLSALFVILIGALLITACGNSVNPVEATKPPSATQAGYPVPPVQQATPAGYPAAGQPIQPDAASAYPADGIVLQIIKADGKVIALDFKGLNALAKQKVTLENKQENVSKLSDALSLGGITGVNKITATGNNGQLVLTKDQAAQAYLDVAANGMIRLLVQGIPQDKWLTGVNGLKVE